jgi:hypothetical protein
MSQFFIATTSGNLPPEVPTSFTTDTSGTFEYPAGTGTAIPDSNNLVLTGDNGIQTVTHTVDTNVIQVRFQRGTTQTVGATTQTAFSLNMLSNTTLTLQVIISGYADNNDAVGGYTTATIKNVAGVASVIDAGDVIVNTDASLVGATFNISASGAGFIITVSGVAARTIDWSVCLPGIVST